jgi:hypothetical protein
VYRVRLQVETTINQNARQLYNTPIIVYSIIFIFIFSLFFNLLCILPLQLQCTEYFSFICVSNYSTWYKYSTLLQKLFPFSFSLYWHHTIPCIKWDVSFQKIMFPGTSTSILKKILQVAYSVLVYENDKYSTEYGPIISKKCNYSIYRSVPGANVGESGKWIAGPKKILLLLFQHQIYSKKH